MFETEAKTEEMERIFFFFFFFFNGQVKERKWLVEKYAQCT